MNVPPECYGPDDTIPVASLPSPEQGSFDAFVSEVVSPSLFYVQLRNDSACNALDDVMDGMETFYDNLDNSEYAVDRTSMAELPGMMVAAVYIEENTEHYEGWHRAMISEVINPYRVRVFYADYGSEAIVKFENIRLLHRQFGQLPLQAVSAELANVKPFKDVPNMIGGRPVWQLDERNKFFQRVKRCNLAGGFVAVVADAQTDPVAVQLIDTVTNGYLSGISLSDWMVGHGLARYKDAPACPHPEIGASSMRPPTPPPPPMQPMHQNSFADSGLPDFGKSTRSTVGDRRSHYVLERTRKVVEWLEYYHDATSIPEPNGGIFERLDRFILGDRHPFGGSESRLNQSFAISAYGDASTPVHHPYNSLTLDPFLPLPRPKEVFHRRLFDWNGLVFDINVGTTEYGEVVSWDEVQAILRAQVDFQAMNNANVYLLPFSIKDHPNVFREGVAKRVCGFVTEKTFVRTFLYFLALSDLGKVFDLFMN